ncbi:unnamed protein product [Trichobilharzia regenti]|nr:unnamed protein product [Trichobilharzia regenti]
MLKLFQKWDDELAKQAQELANTCNYHHNNDGLKTKKFDRIGQNLGKLWKVERAVSMWTDEHENYNFTENSCKPGENCEHYKQVK